MEFFAEFRRQWGDRPWCHPYITMDTRDQDDSESKSMIMFDWWSPKTDGWKRVCLSDEDFVRSVPDLVANIIHYCDSRDQALQALWPNHFEEDQWLDSRIDEFMENLDYFTEYLKQQNSETQQSELQRVESIVNFLSGHNDQH